LSAPALSREHAELAASYDEAGALGVVVRDLGSRAGTFVDGQAIAPGEDWPLLPPGLDPDAEPPAELGIGIAAAFEIVLRGQRASPDPDPDRDPARASRTTRLAVLLRQLGLPGAPWTCLVPAGGRIWSGPDDPLPLRLDFEDEAVALTPDPEVMLYLEGTPVGPGERVELLVHDRLRLEPLEGEPLELEIMELRS
jgi:hypothetical protein